MDIKNILGDEKMWDELPSFDLEGCNRFYEENSNFIMSYVNEILDKCDPKNTKKANGFNSKEFRQMIIEKEIPKEDFIQLIKYYCNKGTNISEKAMSQSSEECRQMIKRMVAFGLVERSKAPFDMTIGRIALAFPERVAILIKKWGNELNIIFKEEKSIPDYLKFSAGASLCTSMTQLNDWIKWAIKNDEVINKKNGPNKHRVRKYAKIQYLNSVFTIDERKEIIKMIEAYEPDLSQKI
ncbi:hypothetical protein BB561_003853 [Smittium simulii]|uniref:Uncharacterized protein n=1 Tax=Smittium simulii TaxID=133385 RepID=A0A2T9YJ93_9FUNG|nr:hypothetical protein BB561_003853 [Smittium simulii]